MQFNINLFNHSDVGQRSLEDVVGIICHQLRALGHQANWIDDNEIFKKASAGYNIVFEGFTETSAQIIEEAHNQGCRFLIIATEEPTPKGFNWGSQKEMVKRQEIFPRVAKFADGIIHLVPGSTQWYSQFCPAAYTELGYAPSLMRHDTVTEPKYDFGFFGSVSKRRKEILKTLEKRTGGKLRVVSNFPDQITRDSVVVNCKIIVQIRKTDEMGLVSSSRCNTALCLGRPVVAEPHDLSHPWDEIVKFTDSLEDFYSTCLFVKSCWRGIYETQFQAFKTKLPPEACIGTALAALGIDSPRRIA